MEADKPNPEPERPLKRIGVMGRLFWFGVVLVAAGLVVFLSLLWMSKRGIDATKEAVVEIATAFRPEEVVVTFETWREKSATGTDGNILEVATATSTETFTRRTNVEMFGKTLPLGTTVSEISVPATYRYHIDLNGEWFVATDGARLMVLAPRIEPSLPVAFDTAGVRKKTKSGWARWDGGDNLAELEKSVTMKLGLRAADGESIDEVREESRIAVAKFVRSWLLHRDAWGEEKFEEIVVVFEDEESKNLSVTPPALRLVEEEREPGEPLKP